MTEIERKALELVNEVSEVEGVWFSQDVGPLHEALCRAIEQHEAFRQEVSDAVVTFMMDKPGLSGAGITRFIIPKPDPLVEIMNEWWNSDGYASIETFRAALAKRGLEIREKSE